MRFTGNKMCCFTLPEVPNEAMFMLLFAKESFRTVVGYNSEVDHIMQQQQKYALSINGCRPSSQKELNTDFDAPCGFDG